MGRVDHTAQFHISTASPDGSARSYPSLISRPRLAFRREWSCGVKMSSVHCSAPQCSCSSSANPEGNTPSSINLQWQKLVKWPQPHYHQNHPSPTYYRNKTEASTNILYIDFRVIKCSRKNISWSKFFVLWTFHENLTCQENMEETDAFVVTTFIMKSDGRRICQFQPEHSD